MQLLDHNLKTEKERVTCIIFLKGSEFLDRRLNRIAKIGFACYFSISISVVSTAKYLTYV